MESNRNTDDPEAILNNFKKLLESDPRTINLDEEEWVELADLAMDAENQFLFFEAVLWGLRAYPESEQLRDREAVFTAEILDLSNSTDCFRTLSRRPHASRLSQLYLLDFNDKLKNPALFYKKVKQLMLTDKPLDDHEIIETIKILVDNDCLEDLVDELNLWNKAVENTEILWYEIAEDAFESFNYDLGLEVVENLNDAYPYNPDYWVLKARLINGFLMEDLFDSEVEKLAAEGVDAVENALAIDPSHPEALKLQQFFLKTALHTSGANKEEFSDTTIELFGQAIENDDKVLISKYLDIIPQSWFNRNMKDYIYLSILNVNNERKEEILNSWIEYELTLANNSEIVNKVYSIDKSPLVAIANRFCLYNDLESIEELYNRVEKICVAKRIENPVAIPYAFTLLWFKKKSKLSSVYNKIEQRTDRKNINFAILTLAKDVSENKKQMVKDSKAYLFNLLNEEIFNVEALKGVIGYNPVLPACLDYLTRMLYQDLGPIS